VATNFDDKAKTWDDDPAKVERARVVAEAIRATVVLEPSTRLLEYGAGTGLVSQALAEHVGRITLAEPSAGMRSVMGDKVAAGTLPGDVRIWDLDLAAGEVPDERFDLIASVMTLHHIPDVAPVLQGFATLLAEGGDLCIVDLEEEDGSFHSSDPGFDGHHGFGFAALEELLRAAGFEDVRFEQCHEIEKEGGTYPLFLVTAMIGRGRRTRPEGSQRGR
jgi:ubiquinone/menaquinone biosynthesis C-methylase UbiE